MFSRTGLMLLLVLGLVQPLFSLNLELEPKRLTESRNTTQDPDDENRIIISEPYKTLIKASAQLAVAQSPLPEYVDMETAMDIISTAGNALSRPSNLIKVFKPIMIISVTAIASVLVIPSSVMKIIHNAISHPEQVLNLDWLPRGISKTGLLELFHMTPDDLLAKVGLQDERCRETTVCRIGELVRCTFPSSSEVITNFITQNASRPRPYKKRKYLNAFLGGLIDQTCGLENETLPAQCAANLIKPFVSCPSQKSPAGSNCQ